MSEITLIAALELTSNSASERRWGGGRILQVWVESEWSAECRAGDRVGGGMIRVKLTRGVYKAQQIR